MRKGLSKDPKYAELMGEDIIGIYLSTEPFCLLQQATEDDEPKLRRFVNHQEDIHDPRLINQGEHGMVILVDIKGSEYAVKIFKHWKQPGPVFYLYDVAIYTSPLAHECRAYARLDSRAENGTWAVMCYGWMKLTDAHFKVLGDVTDTSSLSRWAIIKEYRPVPTGPLDIPTIFANFTVPQKARILPQDV
ncbi:hypothetical protein AYO20_05835 [Fonsecaea nubica]|uniref:Uncharacterized protein n=1 Tax=Fonsecaea nubica TaxID=856822 RepID=A0A178D169_9EURO|nr:hypothetical protein AYO20_05835 [Fonsecaea nubica]OAL34875.1 hypothetical protein AYO20_05835 [Fonsecaea nubica]